MRAPQPATVALLPLMLLWYPVSGHAEDISGVIASTKVIVEDSRLVGDVTCTMTTAPCIQIGFPGVTLRLNGFTITGPANPDETSTCNPTSGMPASDGIAIVNQPGSRVLGPGMVQNFRRHGLLVFGTAGVSTDVTVKHVTSHHNCFSGLLTNAMSHSLIDGLVSVRNAANSGLAPCGGNCLVNSHDNVIVNSTFTGNGSVCATADCTDVPSVASNNDFGLGASKAAQEHVALEAFRSSGARVIAISRRPFSLELARRLGAAETILMNDRNDIVERVKELIAEFARD
jgi:hypothetical protein